MLPRKGDHSHIDNEEYFNTHARGHPKDVLESLISTPQNLLEVGVWSQNMWHYFLSPCVKFDGNMRQKLGVTLILHRILRSQSIMTKHETVGLSFEFLMTNVTLKIYLFTVHKECHDHVQMNVFYMKQS
jgi:hypothetical protein